MQRGGGGELTQEVWTLGRQVQGVTGTFLKAPMPSLWLSQGQRPKDHQTLGESP